MSTTIVLISLALLCGFYMAWNIGANDVANAMGTSVGSGALTLKRAVILAAIMEFAGAFLVGPHVSETIRQNIIPPEVFAGQPMSLALGMIAALLAAGVWLQLATYCGWPVSTTHSIVGAVIGFGAVVGGIDKVNWFGKDGVNSIILSWIISPALSALLAFVIFRLVLTQIFYRPNPVLAARRITPFMVFAAMATMLLLLAFKGLKPFWKDNFGVDPFDTRPMPIGLSPLALSLGAALIGALLAAVVAWRLVRKIDPGNPDASFAPNNVYVTRSLSKAIMHLRRVRSTADQDVRRRIDQTLQNTQQIFHEVSQRAGARGDASEFKQVERIFVYLQIISACFVAFAHGANDVANAIGPLSAAIDTIRNNAVPEKAATSTWLLALGGVGIVVGLATWGWRVMQTIGKRITELTPSRGFCAEFAAGLTILLATVYKMPISTTHTLVGAVLGVGLARGIGALNLNTLRDIVVSWIVTLPAGAGLAIVFFYVLRAIFG